MNFDFMIIQWMLAIPFLFAIMLYLIAVKMANKRFRSWPLYRISLWIIGNICAIITVMGPLAERAHHDFVVHMVGHLLLGMLAPLLMVLGAPMTVFLRALPVRKARKLAIILKSRPLHVCTNPIFTSLLNIGGLWILYTTDLYIAMMSNPLLHMVVHKHVFIAGYLFTMSIIYIDPVSHRKSYLYRAIVLVIALSAHQILSKFIYANPPTGVHAKDAEMGAMLMYYGGDVIDIVIIIILCYQWFKATRPRDSVSAEILI